MTTTRAWSSLASGPDQEANYKGANYGWQKFIGGLERVVAGLQ
jgi:hypothetical protein